MDDHDFRLFTVLTITTSPGPEPSITKLWACSYAPIMTDLIGSCFETLTLLAYVLTERLQKEASDATLSCDYDLCGHVYRIHVNRDGLLHGPTPVP